MVDSIPSTQEPLNTVERGIALETLFSIQGFEHVYDLQLVRQIRVPPVENPMEAVKTVSKLWSSWGLPIIVISGGNSAEVLAEIEDGELVFGAGPGGMDLLINIKKPPNMVS